MGQVTAKIPQELVDILVSEAKKTGMGVQKLAGMILTHGFNDLKQKHEEQKRVHTQD